MSEPKRPMLAGIKDEIGSLTADFKAMAALRWQLARLEFQTAAGQLRRLAICLCVAGVMALTALPVLVVALAEFLDKRLGIPCRGWLLIFGLVGLIGGAAGGYLAWRRFRRCFVGVQDSLEELREDLVWLKEWAGGNEEETERQEEPDA